MDMENSPENNLVKWGFCVQLKNEALLCFSGMTELENIEWRDCIMDACDIR